ncbi:hypothetical protein HDV00_009453 [Rhizophlyctis rosea]|nr:hypothetical protein HDV00_009453 [Rhizophlyctis rosea]
MNPRFTWSPGCILSEAVVAILNRPDFVPKITKMKNWANFIMSQNVLNTIPSIAGYFASGQTWLTAVSGVNSIISLIIVLVMIFLGKDEKKVMKEIKEKVKVKKVPNPGHVGEHMVQVLDA